MHAGGVIREIWMRGDMPGAAIVWEAAGEAELRETIAKLPLFQAGMLEIVAVVPLKPYPGLAADR
ncbi:MAG: muconolactone Delta-isomerase family protein [Terracidiphilus sp.]